MMWEYKQVTTQHYDVEKLFNSLGELGWELVSVHCERGTTTGFFKREVHAVRKGR